MSRLVTKLLAFAVGDAKADRLVPPTGLSARLTLFTAASMAFLAVFALALSQASGRLAEDWSDALSGTATLRVQASVEQREAQTTRALDILSQTPGITSARALEFSEQEALLAPWFGSDLSLESLPVPQLIEISGDGFDVEGLRLRLQAELPDAVLDDHGRWRATLVEAAGRLRLLGFLGIGLIFGTMAAMITLAANAALAANAQIISVLRLVGATDGYIAQAFVRRFTLRALTGAGFGTVAGLLAVMMLPGRTMEAGILTGVRFQGLDWLWAMLVPILAALVAYGATQFASRRVLGDLR